LSWLDNSSNETGFRIERGTTSTGPFTQIATTSAGVRTYSNTGLTASTTFHYRVRANNSAGDSAFSNVANATTLSTTTLPAAPSSLVATSASSTSISLSWVDNSNNETVFRIERATGSTGGSFTQIATVGAGVVAFSDTGQTASTTYRYRVRASNSAGDSAFSNVAIATTLSTTTLPAAPSNLVATSDSNTSISLSWVDNSDNETEFRIERGTTSTGPFTQIAATSVGVTAYSNTLLTASTTYYYRVRANNSAGDSAVSNVATATTRPAAPSGLVATSASSTSISLSWVDNSNNETEFRIERGTTSTGPFAQIATTLAGVTTYSDTGLTVSTTYHYRVRANSIAGDSDYSNVADATTLN
jgi:titin